MKSLAALGLALVLLLAPAVAFADATTTTPQVVTVQTAPVVGLAASTAAGSTTTTVTTAPPSVVVPWGDWLDAAINQVIVPILGAIVLGLLTFLGAKLSQLLPPWLQGVINAKNTAALEQILVPAIATGLKSVGSDVAGQAIDVPAQSTAVANAANYAIEHGSASLVKWAGGPEGIKQKIQARFDMLTTGVTPHATTTIAPTAAAAVVKAS